MSIRNIGNDLVEIDRLDEIIKRYGDLFLQRLFTKNEIAYCSKFRNSTAHFAGRFAAKEAIVKALGTGFGKEVSWHDIEILNDKVGKPFVKLSSRINLRFQNPKIHISLSHCRHYASAVAIWSS